MVTDWADILGLFLHWRSLRPPNARGLALVAEERPIRDAHPGGTDFFSFCASDSLIAAKSVISCTLRPFLANLIQPEICFF
jgi:hypothetical protein